MRDYSDQGVQFIYIYKALAHPETNGYIAPFTLEERLLHVREAERRLGSHVLWICDTMENDLKHALGDAPNSEFIIDPEGKVVRKRVWSRPAELRKDLEQLIGPVDRVTTVQQLAMPRLTPAVKPTKQRVPRVKLPGRMRPLVLKPVIEKEGLPFYVKLRAEAQESLLKSGTGMLYLGFFLDPLYHVHWNDRSAPIRYQIDAPEGVTVTPASGQGPDVDADSDTDPREFLVKVISDQAAQGSGTQASDTLVLRLTVQYIACDDAETFCVPVTQKYAISLKVDADGGSRRAAGSQRGAAPGKGRAGANPRGAAMMVQRMMQRDEDGDGQISRDEAPDPMKRMFDMMDTNDDGQLQRSEIEAMAKRRMRRNRGGKR